MMRGMVVAAVLVCLAPAGALAQAVAQTSPVVQPVAAARGSDVESLDAIITALYDVISGPVGQPRDWNRMRSLFVPGGRLMPTLARQGGGTNLRILEVNDYIALSGPNLERVGFTERELFRRTERFGNIAHVFSTYEGRRQLDDTVIRGINSIQLLYDGARWWIISVYWEAERPDNPLPPEYLPPG